MCLTMRMIIDFLFSFFHVFLLFMSLIKKVAYYKFSIVCEDSITIEETTSSPEKNQWYPPKKYTTN